MWALGEDENKDTDDIIQGCQDTTECRQGSVSLPRKEMRNDRLTLVLTSYSSV